MVHEDRPAHTVTLNLTDRRAHVRPTCTGCGGLMVAECADLIPAEINQEGSAQWRCVNCGDWIDPVILANRHLSSLGAEDLKRLTSGLRRWRR